MTNFKKLLLAGTAVVAIGATPAFATDVDLDAATGTWAGAGTQADDGTVEEAVAGEDLNASVDSTLTITNDQTANDGTGLDDFILGDVTDSSAAALDIVVTTGNNTDMTVLINSFDTDGDFTITGVEGDDADIAVTLTEASSLEGNLTIFTDETDSAQTYSLLAMGGITVDGLTTITASANGTSTLTVNGDSTFTGGVTLDDDTGLATLAVNVTTDGTDLTVEGDIDGAAAGEGTLVVTDADAATTADIVTFTGDIGSNFGLLGVTIGGNGGITGGSARFDGDVTAETILLDDAVTLDEDVTGDFNGDVVATDIILVGASGAANAVLAQFSGDVTGDITLDDDAGSTTVTFDGTSQTVTGDIDGDSAGEGTVNIGTGSSSTSVTFAAGNGIGSGNEVGQVTIGSGATLSLSNGAGILVNSTGVAGSINLDGTLNVETTGGSVIDDTGTGIMALDGTLNVTGAGGLDLGSGGTIHAGWNDTAAKLVTADTVTLLDDFLVGNSAEDMYTINLSNIVGTVDGGGNDLIIDATGSTLGLGLSSGITLDDGDTVTWLTNFSGASDLDGELAAGDIEILLNDLVSVDTTGSSDVQIVGTLTFNDALTTSGMSSASAGTANALLGFTAAEAATAGTGVTAARNALIAAPTNAAANTVAESYSANVDGSALVGVVGTVTTSSLGITGERMAALRSGDETGMAAGNMTHGLQTWAKVFGTMGEQDNRDGVTGYEVDTYGVTVGIDTQTLAEDWVWGLALTYANSDVDKTISATAGTDIDIDTYQIGLYADYKWDAATYVNGQVGYGMNNSDQTRTFGGLVGSADVDSDVFYARLEAGRDYDMDNGWTLTPLAMLNYQHINPDSYTEAGTCTGAGACLSVDTENMNILEAGLGAEASYLHQMADGSFLKPKAHASYRYDFIGDEVEATSSFTGAPATTFSTEGFDAQQNTFNIGAGVEFFSTSNWEMSVNYDYEIKEDYDGHNGYVRAAYKF